MTAGTASTCGFHPAVAALALSMIEDRLRDGRLRISEEMVPVCARCHHLTGSGSHRCNRCGHPESLARTGRHLIADRDPDTRLLTEHDLYAGRRRPPAHVQTIAGHVPARLILSRTRDHGIDLEALGLTGLVLDPRVGLHVTALAAAHTADAPNVAMTLTASALANIAAHGHLFTHHGDLRLRYAIHGKVPYSDLAALHAAEAGERAEDWRGFAAWFLPLVALKDKNDVHPGQLSALLTYYRRAHRARPHHATPQHLAVVREQILSGETTWIINRDLLAAAMPAG